jgi:hypothetical protein
MSPLPDAAPACSQRAAVAAALLALLAVARCGAAAQSDEGPGWLDAHIASEAAAGRPATKMAGSDVGLAIARCSVPALAVDACLKRRAPAVRSECLELAAHVMAATQLTRHGYDVNSQDTLHCTYVSMSTWPPDSVTPDTVFLLALGLLLSARGGARPLALLGFDAAPLAQPRLHAREAELQATLRQVYATRPSAEALLRGAEALELFAALRNFGSDQSSAHTLAARAELLEDAQEDARDKRKRQLLPAARQLAALLLRDEAPAREGGGGDRAALDARARALLTALDVASMGDCAALVRRLETHSALLLQSVRRNDDDDEAEAALRGSNTEVEHAYQRATRLTPTAECARTVVATTANVEVLFHYMVLLQKGSNLGAVVGHIMLPPPRGEAPHAKSAAAVAEAFSRFEMITGQEPLNGGLPLPPQRKQQPRREAMREDRSKAEAKEKASAERSAQPRDTSATPPRREPQGKMIKEGGVPDEAAAARRAATPRDADAVLALFARLLGLLLLSAAAWRLAAAAERRRHKAHGA